jgi:RNA polymerase sigma factor (sigma-70 family)
MAETGRNTRLEQLIAEYRPRLKAFIRRHADSAEDAEDILQDVFCRLVEMVHITMNPVEHVAAWLYRVARNTLINRSKKMREEPLPASCRDGDGFPADASLAIPSGFGSDSPTPETEYLRSLFWQELEAALSELPSAQRDAFVLTELDGLPAKEVAERLNIPLNTLLSRKHYAVVHLRQRLKELYGDMLCGA